MLPAGLRCALPGRGCASDYAAKLLQSLGAVPLRLNDREDDHPALRWASSGLMALTGHADGPPLMCPVPIASRADGALMALQALAPAGAFKGLRGADLLGERAALAGLRRAGRTSAGGACKLLVAADGEFALSLARADDWALMPALLEVNSAADWASVAAAARAVPLTELLERGALLGLAIAPVQALRTDAPQWFSFVQHSLQSIALSHRPLVLDLSALWAGPLCSQLLQALGARVIKVESVTRPDGARAGNRAFFDLLNAGKECIALDLGSAEGLRTLRQLIARADIVIEASRPRALRQLGVVAEELLAAHPGLTWLALSGYGRDTANEQRIAYGDDAAVAAGLSDLMQVATGEAVFVGDAIADPLSGLHAALAAWGSYLGGGGRLISISLLDVVHHLAAFDSPGSTAQLRQRQQVWTAMASPALPPATRTASAAAHALGADTASVVAELDPGPG